MKGFIPAILFLFFLLYAIDANAQHQSRVSFNREWRFITNCVNGLSATDINDTLRCMGKLLTRIGREGQSNGFILFVCDGALPAGIALLKNYPINKV